jgi:RNA polymerase sigma factor (sigma-70 family)
MLGHVTGDAAVIFEAERRRLFGLAYRLLGSAADAEDVLQDAFLRWAAADHASIAEPAAWLTTAVTNLCLTFLASARQRRERYVGTWLPEPVLTDTSDGLLDPLETAEQRESVSMALLMLCERLTAPERAVLILHEAFGYRYQEIGQILGRSEAACRQLRRRAAERLGLPGPLGAARPGPPADHARWRRLVGQFLAAAAAGDVAGLEQVLAEDVVYWSDGGGRVPAALRPVRGRAKVARLFAAAIPKVLSAGPATAAAAGIQQAGVELSVTEVNGDQAMLAWSRDALLAVLVPQVGADRIISVYVIANPDKLAAVARQAAGLPRFADLTPTA